MTSSFAVIGLTGGIASGKSAVARVFRERGIPVLDADALGHLVLAPDGGAYAEVLEEFGRGILARDGRTIDRHELGRLVFEDPERRARLEAITHPAIGELARKGLEIVRERGYPFAVYEAALLVETGMHRALAELIVVSSSVAAQMDRLCARDGLTREAAAVRIASQLPLAEKLALAQHVIHNDGTPEELRVRASEVATLLERRHGAVPA